MAVLLGVAPNLTAYGVKTSPHPWGATFNPPQHLVRQLWQQYYPHWLLNWDCPQQALVRLLTKYELTLAVAESCTGGSIAGLITDMPGASQVLTGATVVYTSRAKTELLHIEPQYLPPGCVGASLTWLLARRLQKRLQTDIGLGVTGALGPSSPSHEINIGDVFIAVTGFGPDTVAKFNFCGTRKDIKQAASVAAINFVLSYMARWYFG